MSEDFRKNLLNFMTETFESPMGIYLDKNTALFQTLETVSAAEASIPVGGKCATLAAQVAHVTYYLDVLERYVVHNDTSPADWGEVWRTVSGVTTQEWETSKAKLRGAYQRMVELFKTNPVWNETTMGGAMAIVVHSAYHLGEIRQALCTLKK